MKDRKEIQPPKWAQKFLEWYCKPSLLEDLQGDLNEFFERNYRSKGVLRAKLIYIIDVFKFLRPYTIGKPNFINLLIHWIMINSYLKTSTRSIVRNKLFSFINIIGLAISMSVGLLLIAFLSDILSFDKFHTKSDRIYRVINDYQYLNGKPDHMASTSVKAGKRIKEEVSGVEEVVIMRTGFGGDAKFGEKIVSMGALWANESFFKVFSFKLLKGNPTTALKDPYAIVLTEKLARKIFGDEDALNKTLKLGNDKEYTVTGVMKDIPISSHLKFEALISFATVELQERDNQEFLKWGSMWMNYVYVLLPESNDFQNLQENLNRLSDSENAAFQDTKITMKLQPIKDIALGPDLGNQIGPNMPQSIVWVISGLSFIVILSACFNYTNLSVARSLRRSREVGIRKVIGAFKSHILGQFIAEAILIALIALLFSFGLFLFLRPHVFGLIPQLSKMVSLQLSLKVILCFAALAILVGILAGILPAFFFARINAANVLKNTLSLKVFGNLNVRKALIVVQYSFSLMFITATIIGYNQYKHSLAFDLGYNTANILNIELQGNKAELLSKSLDDMHEVELLSQSMMITSLGSYYGAMMKYNDPHDSANVHYNAIDENYLPLHGHKFIAGRNFLARANKTVESEVIVNEQTLKRFAISVKNPAKALGEIVTVNGQKLQIVGVVKDFHYGKVDHQISPFIFRYLTDNAGFINTKIMSADLPETLSRIEETWRKIDKVHPLKATFYDDQIEQSYTVFSAMIKIIGYLAFLAISIASLGLLGMVVFTTETRLKEISIRKVLGATEGNLIYLLSKGFLILLIIAATVALPATYLFFDRIALADIAYRAPIRIMELFLSVLIVASIAALIICSQTFKVARSNPAEVLKGE